MDNKSIADALDDALIVWVDQIDYPRTWPNRQVRDLIDAASAAVRALRRAQP